MINKTNKKHKFYFFVTIIFFIRDKFIKNINRHFYTVIIIENPKIETDF